MTEEALETLKNSAVPDLSYKQLLVKAGKSNLLLLDMSSEELFYTDPHGWRLASISKKAQTYEMVVLAIKADIHQEIDYPILKNISKRLLTSEICLMACYQSARNLEYIPKNLVTDEMQHIAKETERRQRKACQRRERERNKQIEARRALDATLINPAKGSSDSEFSDAELPVLCAKPVALPVPPVPIPDVLVPTSNYTPMFHELNLSDDSSTLPVYYISDIHLEHQLDLDGKTLSEAKSLIEGKVFELMSSIQDNRGLILLGGDIAYSVELERLFFEVLKNAVFRCASFNMNIVAVLGNHELWDGDPIHGSVRLVDDIVSDYRSIFPYDSHAILDNSLWLKYQGRYPVLIEESVLLEAGDAELSELCKRSSCIVFGGIGFSGRNPKFNAIAGIYRNTVSSEEDIARSERFCAIYNKVLRCVGSQRVIVLTHTPMTDWSNDQYNPNWIYISGHTHQNTLIRKNDGTTVLSDNQVGYTPKRWHFNCLTICGRYDPFSAWKDGIYSITAKQYSIFNYARGIHMEPFKSIEPIHMIKRDGVYMFFQQKKTLCMLAGGRLQTVTHDIEYYFDRLPLYCKCVKAAFEPYNTALRTISKEVRAFGGTGKIHGCIVDINFLNHIYLDPFDGVIRPYFAFDMSNKLFFENTAELLEASPCRPTAVDSTEFNPHYLSASYKKASSDGVLPILAAQETEPELTLSTIPELVLDRSMYKPSHIMRAIQYIFDQDVVRIWNDSILREYSTTMKPLIGKGYRAIKRQKV